jgi:hypothetical protein
MIPRLHRRGNSFKGALGYVLHDVGKETSERVAWVETRNIFSHPEDAWFEMFDTYRNRAALKKAAGYEARGRDNKTPVLHYTLAWHSTDNPAPDHMKAMALDSLKALGLSEHEAVIACHGDKEHHHVHVVVNTVHPSTGKTAALKFSKLEFSRWAEAYEKEHGIHCEQRIENNERRREIAKTREAEREAAAFALLTGKKPREPGGFVPVNDNSENRRRWFERKEITDKMKALRAALDQDHKAQRSATWSAQLRERDQLDKKTHAKLDSEREAVRKQFKTPWRDLYRAHKRESKDLREHAAHPLERAVFVFRNRARLGDHAKPLTLRRMLPLIVSRRKLRERVEQVQMRERRALARDEKAVTRQKTEQVWQMHRAAFHSLKERQGSVRNAERGHQQKERGDITFARAKGALLRELEGLDALKPKAPVIRSPGQDQKPATKALSPKDVLMREGPQAKAPLTPVKRPERDAPKSRTARAFHEAVHGKDPAKAAAMKALMRKEVEAWLRRPRDDFERER